MSLNRELRRTYRTERGETTERWRKLHCRELQLGELIFEPRISQIQV
jgi:hypothetical protein